MLRLGIKTRTRAVTTVPDSATSKRLDDAESDPARAGHIHTTPKDLFALAVGAGCEAAQVARMRGLRAARVHDILAALKTDFADPAVSASSLAAKLQFSPAYLQRLL